MTKTKLLEKFKKVRVLVIGDIMIDRYWWGTVERISPEAPVPVVRIKRETMTLGGAANVAANTAGLGADTRLIGVIGNDDIGKLADKLLRQAKIEVENLVVVEEQPTTIKTRVIAHSQHVVRIDNEEIVESDEKLSEKLCAAVHNSLEGTDIVILSDYAKGVVNQTVAQTTINWCREKGIPVVVDPKGLDYTIYKNATVLTPNRKESLEACGMTGLETNAIEKAGHKIIELAKLEGLLITQGEDGMKVFRRDEPTVEWRSVARHVFDVTGAGDTVIAVLAVAFASGFDLVEAARLANLAAGFVVEENGTTVIAAEKLEQAMASIID